MQASINPTLESSSVTLSRKSSNVNRLHMRSSRKMLHLCRASPHVHGKHKTHNTLCTPTACTQGRARGTRAHGG